MTVFMILVDLWLSFVGPHLFSLIESHRSRIGFRIACTGLMEIPAAIPESQTFYSSPLTLASSPIREDPAPHWKILSSS